MKIIHVIGRLTMVLLPETMMPYLDASENGMKEYSIPY
jgi:hypothetical protein